jgi:hypothetical protein
MKVYEPPDDSDSEVVDAGYVFLPPPRGGDKPEAPDPRPGTMPTIIRADVGPELLDLLGAAMLVGVSVIALVSCVAAAAGIAWRVFTFIAGIK